MLIMPISNKLFDTVEDLLETNLIVAIVPFGALDNELKVKTFFNGFRYFKRQPFIIKIKITIVLPL